MRKGSTDQTPKRVLARVLAREEFTGISGAGEGPDTTWTNGPRKDFTQISAGDVPGDPPAG